MNVLEKLSEYKDEGYKQFNSKLIPTVDPDLIIGVRTPVLRKFAKEFFKTDESKSFLQSLPHKYYEENNLHAFLVAQIKDFDEALYETKRFLPYIDNWATCDTFMPKVFKKNPEKLLPEIKKWISSEKTYTVRYATGLLMNLFLDEKFSTEYPDMVSEIKSDEYYINMMIAWYFATALAKQYDAVLPYLTEKRLPVWVHNKIIQKAVESYRIPAETKEYLKTLKRTGE